MSEAPTGFRRSKLGDKITLKRGYDLPAQARVPGAVPIVSSSGITGTHNEAKVTGPGVVTGRYGTLGEVFYIEEDFWPHNTALYVTDFKGNDPRFVAYFLRTLQLGTKNAAGAVPGVNRNVLHSVEVLFPEPVIQHRIAGILAAYDDLIENNRRRMALLEETVHLLYHEWFVCLRFPGCERMPIVDGMPEGWGKVKVTEAISFNPKTSLSKGELLPFIPMASLQIDSMVIEEIEERSANGGARFTAGDTLLARITPCLENGKTAFVQFMNDDQQVATGSTEFIVMRSRMVTPYWVYCLARSRHFRQFAINSMVGSDGRQRVQTDAFEKYDIFVPPTPLLQEFDTVAEPVFRQIKLLTAQNRRLREARDLLLPRLMNGSIVV